MILENKRGLTDQIELAKTEEKISKQKKIDFILEEIKKQKKEAQKKMKRHAEELERHARILTEAALVAH